LSITAKFKYPNNDNISVPDVQQFVINPPPRINPVQPDPRLSQPQVFAQTAESYEFYKSLVISDVLWLDKLTRLLYSATLVRTNKIDPQSPLPGHTLVKVSLTNPEDPSTAIKIKRKDAWRPNINFTGYMTVANNFLLFVSEVSSTTSLDEKTFNIKGFAVDSTMAIADMICANRKQWEFENHTLIRPIGLAVFKAIYYSDRRSIHGNLLEKIWSNIMQPVAHKEKEEPKIKLLPI
jgi:hypothetical protein